ncbi:SCP2 sterol-binding domain-containing protein [Lentibacillus salicampi]|uniref:SCP2 sterol-binding domain-containing protein n=1 Tax=Lentibacillus salicampi TaxID=175306 RepID=A0A4Y9AEK2_9BACI|nr:SCP2 sterol-binding domain-containing protein [Lentibacillus salicampi]TFJ94256.1 SCP2 sterol-binding domain-containing protein [Lentibacillus salicampi]
MAECVKPSTDEVFAMIDAAIKYDPAATDGKEGVYQFIITGDDDGLYQMIIDDDGPRTVEGEEKDAQVTLTIDQDDFRDMVGGTLNPTAAFMGGKLKIKGNMGLALKLQTVLNSFSF